MSRKRAGLKTVLSYIYRRGQQITQQITQQLQTNRLVANPSQSISQRLEKGDEYSKQGKMGQNKRLSTTYYKFKPTTKNPKNRPKKTMVSGFFIGHVGFYQFY